jgi:hypothetical protein
LAPSAHAAPLTAAAIAARRISFDFMSVPCREKEIQGAIT